MLLLLNDEENKVDEARNIVIMLRKPMAEILNVIDKTKEEGEETKRLIVNASNDIAEKGSVKEKKEDFLKQLENKITELEYEKIVIMDCAAKFATFINNSAPIPYNDSFNDYLDMLISDEESKSRELRDDLKIQMLKENKETYAVNIENLEKAMADGAELKMIDAQKIYEMKAELMNLKHYGKTLKSIIGIKTNVSHDFC